MGINCSLLSPKKYKKSDLIPLEYYMGNYYFYIILYSIEEEKKFKFKIIKSRKTDKDIVEIIEQIKGICKLYETVGKSGILDKALYIKNNYQDFKPLELEYFIEISNHVYNDCCIPSSYQNEFIITKIKFGQSEWSFY